VEAEFIKPADTRWTGVLAKTQHDFYHLPEYLVFAAKHEGGTPVAFYAKDGDAEFLAPLLIREVPAMLDTPGGLKDAITPYGYPSPLLTVPGNASMLMRFLDAFQHSALEQGIIAAFFRLHPLLQFPLERLAEQGSLVHHGYTVYLDLSLSPEDIWAQVSRTHRRHINRLHKAGFHVVLDDWSLFDQFITLYRATMKRKSADEFYLFSNSYFYDLRAALSDCLHLYAVLSPEAEVAAAGVCVAMNGIVQNHLVGTNEKYEHAAPIKLTLDYLWRWAKGMGYDVLHLGGGVGGSSDSLFAFKAGFSDLRASFYTFRMILDGDNYALLTRLQNEQNATTESNARAFFPEYRRPAAVKNSG